MDKNAEYKNSISAGRLTLDPSSPLYNWHLSDELDPDIFVRWNEVFNSQWIPNSHPNYLNVITILASEYKLTLDEIMDELIIIHWSSSRESWENLCGRSGYLYIWKSQKKQFKLDIISMN